jgi:ribosomal protein S21
MARKANVRVQAKDSYGHQDERSFKILMSAFRQAVNKAGILREYRLRETYESPSEKNRRKRREKQSTILKQQMRESFPETAKKKAKKK